MTTYRIRISENAGNIVTHFLWKDIEANSLYEAQQVAEMIVAQHPDLDLFVRHVVELEKVGA